MEDREGIPDSRKRPYVRRHKTWSKLPSLTLHPSITQGYVAEDWGCVAEDLGWSGCSGVAGRLCG